jgi:transcription elongation factor Elf1
MHVVPNHHRNPNTDIDCLRCGMLLRVYDNEWVVSPRQSKDLTPKYFISCTVCGERHFKTIEKVSEDAIHVTATASESTSKLDV